MFTSLLRGDLVKGYRNKSSTLFPMACYWLVLISSDESRENKIHLMISVFGSNWFLSQETFLNCI